MFEPFERAEQLLETTSTFSITLTNIVRAMLHIQCMSLTVMEVNMRVKYVLNNFEFQLLDQSAHPTTVSSYLLPSSALALVSAWAELVISSNNPATQPPTHQPTQTPNHPNHPPTHPPDKYEGA